MDAKRIYSAVYTFLEERIRRMPVWLNSSLKTLLVYTAFYGLDNWLLPAALSVLPPSIVFPSLFLTLVLLVRVATIKGPAWNIAAWAVCAYLVALLVSALYGSYLSDQDDNTAWVWYVLSGGGVLLILLAGWMFALWIDRKKKPEDKETREIWPSIK